MALYQIANIIPHLKHPEKCLSKQVTCRSGWEISFIIKYLDVNNNIISWTSEDVIIRYLSPLDLQYHRYFLDFSFNAKCKDGTIKTFWIEIKPYAQTIFDSTKKKQTKRLLKEAQTYRVNQAKWEAARALVAKKKAEGQNIEFMVITEKECPWFVKGK